MQRGKRHRDMSFADRHEERPASIIITTLAGRAYPGSGWLYEVLLTVTEKMPSLVERRDGVWWVPNPVQPLENFADRWRRKPGNDRNFFEWITQDHSFPSEKEVITVSQHGQLIRLKRTGRDGQPL